MPRLINGRIRSSADLEKIVEVAPTVGVFGEQLDLIHYIKAGIGEAHFLQTVFSPLSILSALTSRPGYQTVEEAVQGQYSNLRTYLKENPKEVHEALKNITRTLAGYASAVVDTGASGLFFAIAKLARKDVVSEAEYKEFGVPYDLEVLKAVQGAPFNLLHICGPYVYFDAIQQYPVHAINWAAIGQHNPTIGEARIISTKALVGGIDEHGVLQTGTPDQVIQEAGVAIDATGGRRFLLSPGCGTNLDVPAENLHALRRAAR